MNRSELVITIVGLIATFCLPWPCTREPEVSAPHAQRLLAHLQQNDTASTPWAYTAFERARPGPTLLLQPTRSRARATDLKLRTLSSRSTQAKVSSAGSESEKTAP